MTDRLWHFEGGDTGAFRIVGIRGYRGEALPPAARLDVCQGWMPRPGARPAFCLRGVVSNERYVTRAEKADLLARQQPMGHAAAVLGALIPIKKNAQWWALPQDERRAIFEDQSRHIALGLRALPAVARRLHHCRDLGSDEPFDFLTWFDFRPEDAPVFDDLLGALRQTREWEFVEREVEVRVERG